MGVWVINGSDSSQAFLIPQGLSGRTLKPVGWSADNRWIYILRRPDLTFLRVDATNAKSDSLLVLPFEEVAGLDVTPDGKTLVCNVNEGQSDVWLIENFDPDIE